MLDALNEPQAEAVAHAEGPMLVFAGAGSGKTRVITYRIANLVAAHHVPPFKILAVTFTNKAADEMRHRLEAILGPATRELWVGTFHAICARLLRRHAEAAGLGKNFVIYDTQDQRAVMNRVLRELELDEKRYPPRALLARIHKEKQEARGPDEMGLESYLDEAVQKAYVRYEAQLRAANAVDFEDLILRVLRLLEAPGTAETSRREAREVLRGHFTHLLVDEFQDTNATQYRLLRAFSARTRNFCVVGDDDQSIYRWRGADVRNIRGFRKDYPEARIVKLEQNYRSTGNIVRGALGVISPSPSRVPKELFTENEQGGAIHVVETANERDEAAYVTRLVREAIASGIDPRSTAVFYRVHAQSRVLEESMRAANLPYQIVGGTKFFDRAEVKDALSYLRVLINPQSDVDLLRVVNVPPRGIGKTTLDRVTSLASSLGVPLIDAMGRLDLAPEVAGAARKRLGQVRELLLALAAEAESSPPADVLRSVLGKTGYRAALEAEGTPEAEARLENLAELEGSMGDYAAEAEASGEVPTVAGFLERVSLNSELDGMEDAGRTTLMTIHSAKGLEFDAVMLTGMEEDMFPYKGMDLRGDEELDEERRLAYVAITRARKHLVLTHARTRQIFGNTRMGVPSRFLRDLPPEVIQVSATSAARASETSRYTDSSPRSSPSPGSWRHPQAARSAAPPPGERYIDREDGHEVHDDYDQRHEEEPSRPPSSHLRQGARVRHKKFGVGQVVRTLELAEPAVIAFFPGWGEMKVLARFLERG